MMPFSLLSIQQEKLEINALKNIYFEYFSSFSIILVERINLVPFIPTCLEIKVNWVFHCI